MTTSAMTPREEMRVLVGLAAQPLVTAAAAFLLFPVLDYNTRALGLARGRYDAMAAAVSVAFGAAFAAVFVTPLVALPCIAWARRRGPLTLGKSLVGGALLGNVPAAAIVVLASINGGWAQPSSDWTIVHAVVRALLVVAFGAGVGVAGALAFWAIVREPQRGSPA
jgi:hypothetical protein